MLQKFTTFFTKQNVNFKKLQEFKGRSEKLKNQ
jgi:hypothetical protein